MHSQAEQVSSFEGVDRVVADSLRFRRKLAIGEDAYTSLRVGKTVAQLWDVGGVAATGAQVAALPMVATKLFAPGGLLAALGMGAAATTPVGWVIAASLVSAGAYYGVTRLFRSYSESRVEVIPKFINTPIDLLGAALLDLVGSLSVKIALMDGVIHDAERLAMKDHFISDWGYDPAYVERALAVIEENGEKLSLTQMVESFSAFARANPDCNFTAMRQALVVFLGEVAQADGSLDEREEMAIERVERNMLKAESSLPQLPSMPAMPALGEIAAAPGRAAGWIGDISTRLFKKTEDPPVSK
jgi:uncharacterized tellurite resistance protein B-like protein